MTAQVFDALTPAEQLAILNMLAANRGAGYVAQALKVSEGVVLELAARCKGRYTTAAAALQADIDADERAKLPPATVVERPYHRRPSLGAPAATALPSTPTALPLANVRPVATPPAQDSTQRLIDTGRRSPRVATRKAAERAERAIARLSDLVEADAKADAERRLRELEREKAQEAVRKAEETLRQAREQLRKHKHSGGNGRARVLRSPSSESRRPGGVAATPTLRAANDSLRESTAVVLDRFGVEARDVRLWAHNVGVDCNTTGLLPRRVVEAYEAAHS